MNGGQSDLKFPVMYEPGENDPHPIKLLYREGDFAVWVLDHGYEVLATADGRVITEITEPEDRTFQRDLRPLVAELAALRDKAEAYDKLMDHFAYVVYRAFGNETVTTGYLFDEERKAGRHVP